MTKDQKKAVAVLIEYVKEDLRENGGCDHSVGICCCRIIAAIETLFRNTKCSCGNRINPNATHYNGKCGTCNRKGGE